MCVDASLREQIEDLNVWHSRRPGEGIPSEKKRENVHIDSMK